MTDTTSGLDRLADFARTHTDAIEADNQARHDAKREDECRAAAEYAARDYAICFAALGNIPPALEWTGYPMAKDTDRLRVHAVAYLGEGMFLAHRPYPFRPTDGRRPRRELGSFTLVAADFPDTDRYDGPHNPATYATDLLTLAEILHLIQTRRTGQADGTKETETR